MRRLICFFNIWLRTLLLLSYIELTIVQARRHRGVFQGGVPPNYCLCPPKREVCSQARIVPQKKVTGPVSLECISGLCSPPKKYCSCPPNVSKNTFQDKTHQRTPRLNLRFRAKDLFLVFTLQNLWARSEIRNIRFRCALPGNERAPRARLVPRKKINGQDEDLFLVFTPEFVGKIYLCSPPPPQLRCSGAGLAIAS